MLLLSIFPGPFFGQKTKFAGVSIMYSRVMSQWKLFVQNENKLSEYRKACPKLSGIHRLQRLTLYLQYCGVGRMLYTFLRPFTFIYLKIQQVGCQKVEFGRSFCIYTRNVKTRKRNVRLQGALKSISIPLIPLLYLSRYLQWGWNPPILQWRGFTAIYRLGCSVLMRDLDRHL